MATILFAYEFGSGLGHLNRLAAVAKRLLAGNRLVFTIPDVTLGRPVLTRIFGKDIEVFQGVHWPPPTKTEKGEPAHTFADVIPIFSFDQTERLLVGCNHWNALLQAVSPDLIVADFAPTLRLAVMERVPMVVVGNGYTVPPTGRPLPPFRPGVTTVRPSSRANEARLMAAVNEVREHLKGPAVEYFADLFQGSHTFVCTLPEFDPYRAARTTPVVWPFNVPTIPEASESQSSEPIFCYLPGNHPSLPAVLRAISKLDRIASIYVQGVDPRRVAKYCSRNVRIHPEPADFSEVLPKTSLLLHHAGLGTAYAGLAGGIPQVVLPANLEHAITAAGLHEFKVATRIRARPPPDPLALRSALLQVLNDPSRRSASRRAAITLEKRRDTDPVGRIVTSCQGLI